MKPQDFLNLSNQMAAGATEAEWRTAISRAYYATFHAARDLLRELGFTVPRIAIQRGQFSAGSDARILRPAPRN